MVGRLLVRYMVNYVRGVITNIMDYSRSSNNVRLLKLGFACNNQGGFGELVSGLAQGGFKTVDKWFRDVKEVY